MKTHAERLRDITRERITHVNPLLPPLPQATNKHTDDATIAADKLVATLVRRPIKRGHHGHHRAGRHDAGAR